MILGNAGIVSVIASFVVSLRASGVFRPSLNVVIVVAALFILYRIASNQAFAKKITTKIREKLKNKLNFDKVEVQELLRQSEGYGVASVVVGKEAKVVGLPLSESGFSEQDLMVLSVERDDEMIPVPKATTIIQSGDRLICYGKLENLTGLV
jgi:K+/H+ antiporter YhaU regulatory subunit KhtT